MNNSYPLAWPDGWKKTPSEKRRNLGSRMTMYKSVKSLEDELSRLGATDAILSTNCPISASGSYAERYSGSPGAAVYFKYKGKSMTMACDQYFYLNNNVRALALTIESLRSIERHGASDMMERAFKGFTAISDQSSQSWREILDIPPDAKVTVDDVESIFRKLAHVFHPDKGGDSEAFRRIVTDRDNARRELGATS